MLACLVGIAAKLKDFTARKRWLSEHLAIVAEIVGGGGGGGGGGNNGLKKWRR